MEEAAEVDSDFPPPPVGPPLGVLRSDFSPATEQAAAVAALRQCVRREVREVRTEEVGGWRRKGGQMRWARTDTATTAPFNW